jgi:hypothetical protein
VTLLEARCSKEKATRWHYPADLLVLALVEENLFDAAWNAVRLYGASLGVQQTLAGKSEADFMREALDVYESRVAGLVESGPTPLTSKRRNSSRIWQRCEAQPNKQLMSWISKRGSAANAIL